MGRDARHKLNNNNDIKIIIQAMNSQTGVGKTTLAIQLCRWIDQTGSWNAEEKAFIEPQDYLNSYLEYEGGSALLLDEIGAGADSRRATSKDNVKLSQGWQMLRARNVATVATLPSTNMLDNRMLELADYWVLVKEPGIAQPYRIVVNDFNGRISRDALPGDEHLKFPDLPDNDPDKKYLDNIKDRKVSSGGMKSIPVPEHEEKIEKAEKKARKSKRNEFIRVLSRETDMTYAEIGALENVDLTKQTVGQIVRGEY